MLPEPNEAAAPPIAVGGRLYHWLVPILTGERTDVTARLLVALLTPLAAAYAVGLEAYLLPYRTGLRKKARLPCAVISVGNFVSGGTGKTGLTIRLARLMTQAGLRACVLSRGFRSASPGNIAIVSSTREILLGPETAGDEAYLMARELPGVPVIIGKDRRITGAMAVEQFGPDVVILDDGAQYYQLHRDLEIILVNAARPFGNGMVLPAGVLREPAWHIRRASAVVVHTTGNHAAIPERLRRRLRGRPVFCGQYEPAALMDAATQNELPLAYLGGKKVATVCGLGNPSSFEATVQRTGVRLIRRYRLPDHASMDAGGAEALSRRAAEEGAEAILMSEKDFVKWPRFSSLIPVLVLRAEFRIRDEESLLSLIKQTVTLCAKAEAGA